MRAWWAGVLIGVSAAGCNAAPAPAAASAPMTASTPRSPAAALVEELERQPQRVVRVIVTVRGGAADAVRAAATAKAAGAASAEPIAGRPMLVVEGRPAPLRALLDSGVVLQMQLDAPAPTN